MRNNTKELILQYITDNGNTSPIELSEYFSLSRQAIHLQLNKLLGDKEIERIGAPPKVVYRKLDHVDIYIEDEIVQEIDEIDSSYLNITPTGKIYEGFEGFTLWCLANKLPIKKTAQEYVKTITKVC